MTRPRKAYVVSPAEPSGASWLLNCLLELDVKVGHQPCVDAVWRKSRPRPPADYVWQEVGGRYTLRAKARMLEKWLPACSRRAEMAFRADVAVDYDQGLPADLHRDRPVVYFVRDPRDAMYSMYRRVAPEMSCFEYLRFPNPRSLLTRIDHWALHVRSWAEHPRIRFLRFEDYKRDPRAVLEEAVGWLGVDAGPGGVEQAIRESAFEKAAEGERRYRDSHPQDQEVINRSGRVGEWSARPDLAECVALIERRVGDLLARFGYARRGGRARVDAGSRAAALDFAERLDEDLLRRSRLPPDEVLALLDSLEGVLDRDAGALHERLASIRSRFAEGTPHHFERLRELRARLKSRPGDEHDVERHGGSRPPGGP